jgi:adenosyl cobinamide kinase/adenosyl cobinamide phosphate guanylyltransferase
MSLELLPVQSRKGKSKKNQRTVAIVETADAEPAGVLRISEEDNGEKLIELPPSLVYSITPETRPQMVDNVFIVGGQGSGKSTWAGNYCRHFINAFQPEPEYITIISSDDYEDSAYNFPHRHIKIDDDMITNPITLDDLTNPDKKSRALVIFDDIEGISNPKKQKAVDALTEAVLTMGRKRHLHCLFISHRSANGKMTKNILNELTAVVWFPKLGGGNRNLTYMLTKHLSVPEGMREALKGNDWGRWICLITKVPQVLISERRSAIYDADEVESAIKKRTIIDKKRSQKEAESMLRDEY